MLIKDRFTRDLIAEAIRRTVDEVVSNPMTGISQEPQITGRVGHPTASYLRIEIEDCLLHKPPVGSGMVAVDL